jgi:hypothetical protein
MGRRLRSIAEWTGCIWVPVVASAAFLVFLLIVTTVPRGLLYFALGIAIGAGLFWYGTRDDRL